MHEDVLEKKCEPKSFKSSFDQLTYGSPGNVTPQIENSRENYYDTSMMRQSGAKIIHQQ